MILIEFRSVTKTYGVGQAAVRALRGVDIRIEEGEFVAIMGPSGSGKSTCLHIMGCLDTPTSGEYLFKGINVAGMSRYQRALLRRYHLGFVFQGFHLLGRTNALENVELPLIYQGLPPKERRSRAKEALAVVGLSGWEKHAPAELSGGQQQRVAIARALVTRPSVILADEPTGNLDSVQSHEIMKLLTVLNENHGITVVMITHDPEMALYARRLIRFFDGQVVSDEPNGSKKP
ncbi:MAG: ABC transporter ATP-binding protein [Syntrophobacterales bacterium]|nr:ABC transporter ATP-binding protein [Syntrophobacterales bacterium]